MRCSVKVGKSLASGLRWGLAGAIVLASIPAALGANCKPGHFRAPFFVKSMGACGFDAQTLSFAGTPVEQAMCLMRGMDATRNLAPRLDYLPVALASRIGETGGLPSRDVLSSYLSKQDLEWDFAAHLWQPVSRARDNDPDAPQARYFVIHDTSGPNYGHRSFPDDIDSGAGFNNLANFACSDGWGRAHIFINRAGHMLVAHDYGMAWRETKFEQAAEFGGALRGLFLHNELVQPRRSASGHGGRNDARSPDPAFAPVQYDRLALLYVIASVRAERWLIPAFHAAIDAEIPNGHDDPLNFDIGSFAQSLDHLIDTLEHPQPTVAASLGTAANDAAPEQPSKPEIVPMADGEAANPPPPPIDAANKSPTDIPHSAAIATPKPPEPAPARVAVSEGESHREQKSANADDCTTRRVRGHRRRVCEPERVKERARPKHPVRSVDRRVSHESDGARHHGGDLHTRHARTSSRHGRA